MNFLGIKIDIKSKDNENDAKLLEEDWQRFVLLSKKELKDKDFVALKEREVFRCGWEMARDRNNEIQ